MQRLNDGNWIDFTTEVARFSFRDPNGSHEVVVGTDGEFWRVVSVDLPNTCLTPDAARKLAKALVKAANVADKETERLKKQDALINA